jgi:hypothetical protein
MNSTGAIMLSREGVSQWEVLSVFLNIDERCGVRISASFFFAITKQILI